MRCLTIEKKLGLKEGARGVWRQRRCTEGSGRRGAGGGEQADASDHAALSGGSETNNGKKEGGKFFWDGMSYI